jgi:hypothetical protein
MHLILLAGLLSLPGCQHSSYTGSYSNDHLPTWVSATVRFLDGDYGSALVTLGNPRNPPEVRYSQGLWIFDGQRLLQLESQPRVLADHEVVHDLSVNERVTERQRVLSLGDLGHTLTIDSVSGDQINVSIDGQSSWFSAASGAQSMLPGEEWSMTHFGPGQGFEVVMRPDDVVSLKLPMAEKGIALFQNVAAIVSLSWITPGDMDTAALKVAERHYKAVMPIFPVAKPAVADGELDEWRKDKALAVDQEPCVLSGVADWEGPRDGSFGVATRVSGGRLLVAVRVRDDALVFGEDRIEVELDARSWSIPLQEQGPIQGIVGVDGAFTDAVDYGTGLELSLPLPPPPEELGALPLVVRFIDVDPGQGPTTLANAPSMRALAVRYH